MKCHPASGRGVPKGTRVCTASGREFTLHPGKTNKAGKANRAKRVLKPYQFTRGMAKNCGHARDWQGCMGRQVSQRA